MSAGTLFVVSTPLGNLGDMSPRAIQTLKDVDLILTEDTRVFRKLATAFEITTPCKSYHEHNERSLAPKIITRLLDGERVALVSDAGTPCINDPGYHLLNACHENEIAVSPIVGPCAAIAALSVSGFATHSVLIKGFLPHKPGKKKALLEESANSESTTIFFESPQRLAKTLNTLASLQPEAEVFVGREITKLHEEFVRGSAQELADNFEQRSSVRGEIVLLVNAAKRK